VNVADDQATKSACKGIRCGDESLQALVDATLPLRPVDAMSLPEDRPVVAKAWTDGYTSVSSINFHFRFYG
jgi:hypothetical protein